jgi:hypothetical protein
LIELSRALARQFRAVVRKSVLVAEPRGPCPTVVCRAGRQGLMLSCQQGDIALRHHTPGSFPNDQIALPYSLLMEFEGGSGVVTLEQTEPLKGRANWQDRKGPHTSDFAIPDFASLPPPPEAARNAVSLESDFLRALDEAGRCSSRDVNRYATNHVLLRGRDGAVIGTDGKQLLIQRGFKLPWKDNQHLPALPVFGGRELPSDQPVHLGLKEQRITVEVGPWLFSIKVNPDIRYPDVDRALPNPQSGKTSLQIGSEDANALVEALPKLPGGEGPQRPITLELGRTPAVRARDEKGQVAEVVLAHSKVVGQPMRVVMDRRFLYQAVRLGFSEVLVTAPNKPLLCQDARRSYLWMPLDDAEPVADRKTPPASTPVQEARGAPANPEPRRRNPPMPANGPPSNGEPRNGPVNHDPPTDPMAEAEALRAQLQEALVRTNRLIAVLKNQRRQNRVVQAAMDSLRRLQPDR